MLARASLALLFTIAACGGDDSNSGTPVDASVPKDTGNTNTNAVQTVACPTTVPLTVTTDPTPSPGVYKYSVTPATIAVGDIVHFMMPSSHNVAPKSGVPSDPGLSVGFGGDVCLKFTKAGTFNFFCTLHSFSGAITVQ